MAEVHLIGEIVDAQGFSENELFCSWSLKYGGGWRLLAGSASGQTHTASGSALQTPYFAHPIDVHLYTRSIQGWPKIELQVWNRDAVGRAQSAGYGFCHVPTYPGEHQVSCGVWRPLGNAEQEMKRWLLGHSVQLTDSNVVCGPFDRRKLSTVSVGRVRLRLFVIMRNFDKFDIEC